MEEDQNNKPTQPNNGQFMDVQPPKPESREPVGAPPVSDTPAPAPATPNPITDDSQPSAQSPQIEPADTKADGPVEPVSDVSPLAISEHVSAKKSHKSRLPVIVAIVVALGLAGLGVFAYMQSQNSDNLPLAPAAVQEEPTAEEELDQAVKEVDQAIEATDGAADFPEEDLSDPTLGF
ncbi:hypothetical protein BH23PAT1_BH23PAT1_3270 [soil metagenome]